MPHLGAHAGFCISFHNPGFPIEDKIMLGRVRIVN